jgi:hypothetical protein
VTSQDIYAWTQIILLIVVGGGLAWYIRLLKNAVDAQKATIDALKATIGALDTQLKVQSTVQQDSARSNEMMKRVLDSVDAPAMMQRWEQYRQMVDAEKEQLARHLHEQADRDINQVADYAIARLDDVLERVLNRAFDTMAKLHDTIESFLLLAGRMMRFMPRDQRMVVIEAANLTPLYKRRLHNLVEAEPYLPSATSDEEDP